MLGAISAVGLLVFVAESKTNEAAYGHWNYLLHIAKAHVVQERCPRLRVNGDVLIALAKKYKVSFGAGSHDFSALTQMMAKSRSVFQDQSMEATCVFGVTSFGPNGSLVKDLMIEK